MTTAAFARPALRWLWRELRVGVPMCFGFAVFFSMMLRAPFGSTLVHSLCIGLPTQFLIEAGRYGFSWQQRRRDPGSETAQRNWPGWAVMVPWIALSAAVAYALGSALADALVGGGAVRAAGGGDLRLLVRVGGASVLLAFGITYVFYVRGRMAAMEARAEAARRAAADTRLKLLESQLEPHMLFNTLANLRVLIALDAPRAQAMLDHLISYLRATLGASRAVLHPLADEFARVADYVQLMQVRMGARLATRIDLPPELAAHPVPPLLLQPLVENAIRHGLEPQVGAVRLTLSARRDGPQLVLEVRDTGVGLPAGFGAAQAAPAADGSGFGLQQVRERLHALHGTAATLDLAPAGDAEGGTRATVRLPFEAG